MRLQDILRSAVEAARPGIEGFGHQLAIDFPNQSIVMDVDPNQLTQVVANLLNNAAKFTPGGGQIWLTAKAQNSDAVVTVRDALDAATLLNALVKSQESDRVEVPKSELNL